MLTHIVQTALVGLKSLFVLVFEPSSIQNVPSFQGLKPDFALFFRKSGLPNDVMSWDACRLPLRDGLLDVLVCDLPFGKRIGYKGRNFMLYPAVLKEMGRVCKYKGKAVLLTQHKSAMNKALNSLNRVWQKQGTFFMNMGGLNAGIYVLKKIAR